jgi:hypothetical protein
MKQQIPAEDIANKLSALAAEVKASAAGTAGFLYQLAGWLNEGGDALVKRMFMTKLDPQSDIDRLRAKMALETTRKNADALDA